MSAIEDIKGPLQIDALGSGGDGLSDAGPVAFALPGEVIENGKIATPSPSRVAPACRHFGTCGGCQLQHAADDFLADWKTDLVRKALASQGLDIMPEFLHISAPGMRRRVTFSGRRTKKTVQLGFFARRSDALVSIEECPVVAPEIVAALDPFKELVRLGASRKSVIKLAVTLTQAGLDVAVSDAVDLDRAKLAQAVEIARAFARLSWNGEVVATHKPPVVSFDGIEVVPPPGAFLQATESGQAALIECVSQGIGEAKKVIDLFAGCGTFALPLAQHATIHAVESDAAALGAMDSAWRKADGLKTVSTEVRDLFRRPLLGDEMKGWEAIVLDPPRAGAAAQIAEIAGSSPARVVHVSCNPSTFARDAKTLIRAGLALDWVKVIDQFRWTTHIELVACFSR